MKSVLCQKSFLEVIQSDTNLDILKLYTKTGELDPLCMIISKWKPTKYPDLTIFLLVDKHLWTSQGYHFQFMPYTEKEETITMHNIIPVLIFNYVDDVKT